MSEAKKAAEVSPEVRLAFEGRPPGRLMNVNMHVDYVDPITDGFLVESELLREARG